MAFQISLCGREYALAAHSQACLVLEQSMTEFCLPLARALEGRHERVNLVFYAHLSQLFTSKSPFCSFSIDLRLKSFGFDVFGFLLLGLFFLRKVGFSNNFSCWSDEFHRF